MFNEHVVITVCSLWYNQNQRQVSLLRRHITNWFKHDWGKYNRVNTLSLTYSFFLLTGVAWGCLTHIHTHASAIQMRSQGFKARVYFPKAVVYDCYTCAGDRRTLVSLTFVRQMADGKHHWVTLSLYVNSNAELFACVCICVCVCD